jgi:hypothetical protein
MLHVNVKNNLSGHFCRILIILLQKCTRQHNTLTNNIYLPVLSVLPYVTQCFQRFDLFGVLNTLPFSLE